MSGVLELGSHDQSDQLFKTRLLASRVTGAVTARVLRQGWEVFTPPEYYFSRSSPQHHVSFDTISMSF
jgi:hypothetical protein